MTKNTINMGKALDAIRNAAIKGANEGAMALHAQAIPLTPFRTGDLRNSLQIEYARHLSANVATAVIFSNLVYARIQHEQYPNKKHPGTQMKFLTDPMDDPVIGAHIRDTIAGHIRSAL